MWQNLRKKRWQYCCLFFLVLSCHPPKNDKGLLAPSRADSLVSEQKVALALDSIYRYQAVVRSGDVVTRTGQDFTSEAMRLLSSKDRTYSHCGIASWEHDSLFVYHAIGGECNPDQQLRRDPFVLFCNPYENRGFGIFRYDLALQECARLIDVVHGWFLQKIRFDMAFDLATDDRMYCSEFVYKALTSATNKRIVIATTTLNHICFIALDNLTLNPHCKQIKRIRYQPL